MAEKPSEIRDALKQSVAENIIPSSLANKLDDVLKRLDEIAVDDAFEIPNNQQIAPLGPVLQTTPSLDEQPLRDFIRFTRNYEAQPNRDFWVQAQTELGDLGTVRAIQRTCKPAY